MDKNLGWSCLNQINGMVWTGWIKNAMSPVTWSSIKIPTTIIKSWSLLCWPIHRKLICVAIKSCGFALLVCQESEGKCVAKGGSGTPSKITCPPPKTRTLPLLFVSQESEGKCVAKAGSGTPSKITCPPPKDSIFTTLVCFPTKWRVVVAVRHCHWADL